MKVAVVDAVESVVRWIDKLFHIMGEMAKRDVGQSQISSRNYIVSLNPTTRDYESAIMIESTPTDTLGYHVCLA